ncbi:hypothetical protein GGI20_005930 [Coemansia sp. BCRC 34301]|nr:hypothetical protein GGI20_005930 [Coemansia sp. BCRC 34301]
MFVAGAKRKHASGSRAEATGTRTTLPPPSPAAEIKRWYGLGMENFRERQYRNALDYHNRAVALAANEGIRDAKLYSARAHTLYKLREFARALADAKEATRINDALPAGYMCMASILAATGKLAEALAVVDQGLDLADARNPEYKHLQLLHSSLSIRLDPSHPPAPVSATDPMVGLPVDVVIMLLRLVDMRTLYVCRNISTRWLRLIDSTPVLWSNPRYHTESPANTLTRQLPAYVKAQRRVQQASQRVPPDSVIRNALEKSQASLITVAFPDGSGLSAKVLAALFACPRPHLANIVIGRATALKPGSIHRVLNWCLSAMVTTIRLPYCPDVGDTEIEVIAKLGRKLRVLDISGCVKVSMKRLFMTWNMVLAGAGANAPTGIEELFINDHPGIVEFLVYSSTTRHFGKLRVLHAAIRDQAVFTRITNLGPLLAYFQRMTIMQAPFPDLRELNIDGAWDTTMSNHRFESTQLSDLLQRSRLFSCNLRRFSALDSSSARQHHLQSFLQHNLPSLQQLHLTRATSLNSLALVAGAGALAEPLQLASLDLSGCVGVSAQGLMELVARCRNLTHVNLGQTAADNSVLSRLTEAVSANDTVGIEVLVLDATDVTGAAVRDFAVACAARYCSQRGGRHARRIWRLQLLDVDNCANVGSDAVALTRDLLSTMSTLVLAAL